MEIELTRRAETVNELLARYGVKFGIYKNNEFKEQLFRSTRSRGSLRKRSSPIWKKA